jgi:cysteinyl-tRNA synthetase
MAFRIYNTLTKSLEEFRPLHAEGEVTFYSCGPTVYDDAHIGNFRSFLNADTLRRALELHGMHVKHVMNITDVGHMTEDDAADGGGEDKMAVAGRRIAEAKKSGKLPAGTDIDPSNPYTVAEFYAQRFLEDARHLGLKVAIEEQKHPELMPRPTRCVPQMIALVEQLVARGHAYVAKDGVVYFSVQSFPAYGRLSGNTLENLREGEGGRISAENQAVKRHPADFMLWKPDPTHLMRWPSPWGDGYPGWHLECSAMAKMLLGDSGRPHFARVWFHTRHLQVEGEKMSKSKGNFFTARDLFAKGVTPAALRLELVRTHYRTNSNFTLQGLRDCQRMIDRWSAARAALIARTGGAGEGPFQRALVEFKDAVGDDLNLARAMAALNTAIGEPPAGDAQAELAALDAMNSVLGVFERNTALASAANDDLAAKVEVLLERRKAARAAKDWAESDRVRDELTALGVRIKDGPQGTTWERAV